MASHLLFKSPSGEVVKVKTGFSWHAFFVGSLRAMLRQTWVLIGLAVAAYFMFSWVDGTPAATSRNIALLLALLVLCLAYMVFCGVQGNRWLMDSLLRRGFRKVGEEKR